MKIWKTMKIIVWEEMGLCIIMHYMTISNNSESIHTWPSHNVLDTG